MLNIGHVLTRVQPLAVFARIHADVVKLPSCDVQMAEYLPFPPGSKGMLREHIYPRPPPAPGNHATSITRVTADAINYPRVSDGFLG